MGGFDMIFSWQYFNLTAAAALTLILMLGVEWWWAGWLLCFVVVVVVVVLVCLVQQTRCSKVRIIVSTGLRNARKQRKRRH